MERWDLYDKDRKILSKKVTRGETLCDNEYHLVINAWIKNKNNEFLITQNMDFLLLLNSCGYRQSNYQSL